MDRAIIVQKFVMEMDYASDEYKTNARALKDELYLLVDRIATSLQTAFKSLLTGYETPKVEVTPEITIERSKVTSVGFFSRINVTKNLKKQQKPPNSTKNTARMAQKTPVGPKKPS